MSWRPMETAPLDGTSVFLLLENGRADLGHFHSEQTFEFGKLKRETHEWWTSMTTFLTRENKPKPAYWMPIPPAPKGGE